MTSKFIVKMNLKSTPTLIPCIFSMVFERKKRSVLDLKRNNIKCIAVQVIPSGNVMKQIEEMGYILGNIGNEKKTHVEL